MKKLSHLVVTIGLFLAPSLSAGRQPGYVGSETCGQCHEEIYRLQSQSNMARTWQSADQGPFDAEYSREIREGPFLSRVYSRSDTLRYSVQGADGQKMDLPVHAIVGSNRFGVSLLFELEEVAGQTLARSALMEARYMHDSRGVLGMSPGHRIFRPSAVPGALGRVLQEEFAEKCLTCHGSPEYQPTGEAGVRCENCHGPGRPHLEALETGGDDPAMVNPADLPPREVMKICSSCHTGFRSDFELLPQDLLISEQVRAMEFSECYIQSDGGFSCTDCHDPHQNTRSEDPKFNQSCLGCHAVDGNAAAPCPVNQTSGCTGCHMPVQAVEGFQLTDHWIRVHPETGSPQADLDLPRSQVKPRRLFLREIVSSERHLLEEARRKVMEGSAEFDELARQLSKAPSARQGGFLGEIWTSQLSPALAEVAASLRPGEMSSVHPFGSLFRIVQRMPRDFRFEAMRLQQEASVLMARGDLEGAVARLTVAVRRDPHFIRALNSLAVAYAQQGQLEQTLELLNRAIQQAPRSAESHRLLGRALGMAQRGPEQIQALRRAISLEPNHLEGRLQLGTALAVAGRLDQAMRQFQAATLIDPLSAVAYLNLSRTEQALGKSEEAARHLRMAQLLDPRLKETGAPG